MNLYLFYKWGRFLIDANQNLNIMKKIITLSVLALAFGTISCKKCKTCTTDVTQVVNGITMTTSSTSQEYCGDDYDNAPAEGSYEQSVS